MIGHLDRNSFLGVGDPVREMRTAALAENIVTESDIRKAQNVG